MKYLIESFTPADQERHATRLRKSWLTMFGVYAFSGLFLLILLMMDQYKNVHNIIYIAFSIVYLVLAALATPTFIRMYKDSRDQQKICGEFPADKLAAQGRNVSSFTLQIPTPEKVYHVRLTEALYYKIVPTIPIYVEISRHSSTLLRLVQQGKEIAV